MLSIPMHFTVWHDSYTLWHGTSAHDTMHGMQLPIHVTLYGIGGCPYQCLSHYAISGTNACHACHSMAWHQCMYNNDMALMYVTL